MKNRYFNIIGYIILTSIIMLTFFIMYKRIGSNSPVEDPITYQASFKLNGATSLEKTSLSCTLTNNKCLITMPKATRNNGQVLGYSLTNNAKKATYQIGEQVMIEQDTTFYVISNQQLSFNIVNNSLDYLSTNTNQCLIYNQEETCNIKVPFFNQKGYEVRGYSTSKDSLTGYIFPYQTYQLKKDINVYPIYNTLTRNTAISVNDSMLLNNITFDVENGCHANIYNTYLNYFQTINDKAPYLNIGSKITLLTDKTFNDIWGNNYVGMNYGPKSLRLIDIRCSNTFINNYYATIIHEMAHTWDFYYSNFYGQDISQQSDIINLFNKYKKVSSRPFRDYSYSDIKEFFADMVRYYYLKYTDPISEYSAFPYPEDIKLVLEKYIAIANNHYSSQNQ